MSSGINAIGNLQGKVDSNNALVVSIVGGTGVPGSPVNSVQFNSAGAFAGSADLTFDDTTDQLTLGGYLFDVNTYLSNTLSLLAPTGQGFYLASNADAATFSAVSGDAAGALALYGTQSLRLETSDFTLFVDGTHDIAIETDGSTGVMLISPIVTVENDGIAVAGGIDAVIGVSNLTSGSIAGDIQSVRAQNTVTSATVGQHSFPGVFSNVINGSATITGVIANVYMPSTIGGTATIPSMYGTYFSPTQSGTPTITTVAAHWVKNLIGFGTNPYAFWYDGGPGADATGAGVFRVNQFGILAYYNPAFTKYTPGLANFEREIIRWGDTGVYGTDNIAYIGVEAGGTGTNRVLSLTGASVQAETIPGTFAFMKAKLQTSVNATTGLVAGVLAATTNASIVITDGSGQAYRVPCII